jgi:hypothetical protein
MMMMHLPGSRSGRATLRREQRERLESKHRGKPNHGKEGEIDHRCCKHSPRRRRNGGTPVGHPGRIAVRREQCDMTPESRNSGARIDIYC